ncbi:MAG: agmatinase family protein [Bacteroidota bacterium]
MSKEDQIKNFDPNGLGIKSNLFGLPFNIKTSELIIIPVPWEVTVSYRDGTALGPKAILEASMQVDLNFKGIHEAWKLGISMLPFPEDIYQENKNLRRLALQHIASLETATTTDNSNKLIPSKINEACENLNVYVRNTALKHMSEGKMIGLLGGDHSIPIGFIRALSERHDRFGILQLDAHADLRKAYEGFTYSHASIMFNALKLPSVQRLIQVGIRDYCEEEVAVMTRAMGRIVTFFDEDIKTQLYSGKPWEGVCQDIIKVLPDNIYISFDIDALDPKLCPNTGTPVAGGFEFHQITFLIKQIVLSGKRIIGFDLNEVAPGSTDWDANVGARMLYQLCNWMAVSQGRLKAG